MSTDDIAGLPPELADAVCAHIDTGNSSHAARVELSGEQRFVKWQAADRIDPVAFQHEARALAHLGTIPGVRVPQVLDVGISWIVTEWIDETTHRPGAAGQRRLADMVAVLHSTCSPDGRHGWRDADAFMFATRMSNRPVDSFSDFWLGERIEPELGRARDDGLLSSDMCAALMARATDVAEAMPHEQPVLVHGDLWVGNVLVAHDDMPVLIDPAMTYTHREVELATAHAYGDLGDAFWDAYEAVMPIADGFKTERRDVLLMHHLLVHLNEMGEIYLPNLQQLVAQRRR